LSELTENVVYRFSQILTEKGYLLQTNIEQNVLVEADENKIEEVLYNLVGNSINYTGEDKTVKVYLTVNGSYATLEILDSGKGIDKDKIDGIWEKYLRYSETHHRAVKGTGVGLSIVKTILDAHNIKYGVISKRGVGSNFFIKFNVVEQNIETGVQE
jgi:signal transduction histidine kinase